MWCSNAYFNSVIVYDADGTKVGTYRKAHIPDSPGYHEKWHFAPGDTGFRIFRTRYANIGVAICWDQWFPEAARCMVLGGAEILFYPTAIGSEPQDSTLDSRGHWQRCMQGHAASNVVPVVVANRVGREISTTSEMCISFYGSSFMTDHTGYIVAGAGRNEETVLLHSFSLDHCSSYRYSWGIFRDRRPELYHPLISLSGSGTSVAIASAAIAAANAAAEAVNKTTVMQNSGRRHSSSNGGESPVSGAMPTITGTRGLTTVNTSAIKSIGTSPSGGTMSPSIAHHSSDATAVAAVAAAAGMSSSSLPLISMPVTPGSHGSAYHVSAGALGLVDDPTRKIIGGLDLHEATFIGDVKASAQRRPRGRCWACRAKTTYECKTCDPGPVPLCNRTARDCWWKYHAGDVTPFVPNKRGRKRKCDGIHDDEDDDDNDGSHKHSDAVTSIHASVGHVNGHHVMDLGAQPGSHAAVDVDTDPEAVAQVAAAAADVSVVNVHGGVAI